MVIAIQSYNPSCWPGEGLDHVLYNGPNPQEPNPNPDGIQPYQSFTVQVSHQFDGQCFADADFIRGWSGASVEEERM